MYMYIMDSLRLLLRVSTEVTCQAMLVGIMLVGRLSQAILVGTILVGRLGVSTEVTFGRGDLSVSPLGGFAGAQEE